MSTGKPRLFQGKGEEIRAILADLMRNKLEPRGVQMEPAEMDEWLRVAVYGDGERAGLLEAVTEGSWDRERIKRWCEVTVERYLMPLLATQRAIETGEMVEGMMAEDTMLDWYQNCDAIARARFGFRSAASAASRRIFIHLRRNPRLRALREVLDYDHTKDTVPMSVKALSSGKLPGLIWHPQIFRDLLDDLVRWDAEAARAKGGLGETPPEAA